MTNDGTLTLRAFVERFAAGLGARARRIAIPATIAWSVAHAWDTTAGALLGPSHTLSLTGAVQFLGGDNPYSSARAEQRLGWRAPCEPADAAERTGASFRSAPRTASHP